MNGRARRRTTFGICRNQRTSDGDAALRSRKCFSTQLKNGPHSSPNAEMRPIGAAFAKPMIVLS